MTPLVSEANREQATAKQMNAIYTAFSDVQLQWVGAQLSLAVHTEVLKSVQECLNSQYFLGTETSGSVTLNMGWAMNTKKPGMGKA